MNWLQLHPDGILYIRDADDVALYEAPLADFTLDYGQAFPAVPFAQLECFEGRIYVYDAKGNECSGEGIDPAPYQAIIDALPSLQAAKAARETPPPPTAEELAERQRLVDIDTTINAASFGSPAVTLADLKAMTRDQFNTWWSANVTTAAQAMVVLKWIAWIAIRRLR